MRIFVGAVLACAALVGTARADTYCVSPATGCDHTAASIQAGLGQAASHAGDDTVQLGAASYNLDTDADGAANDLTYPTSGAQGAVTLRGAGPGQTTVTRNLAVLSSEALIGGTLGTTGDLDVRDLKVQLPSSQGAAIATLGTVFDDLSLAIPDNSSTGIVLTASGSALTSSTITSTLTTTTYGTCVKVSPNSSTASFTITDVTATGCTLLLSGPSGTGRTVIERLALQSPFGMSIGSGAHVVLDNSLVRINGGSGSAILTSVSNTQDTTTTVNQSTVVGPGSSAIGIQAFNNASPSGTAHVNLYDSIVRAFATSLRTVGDGTTHLASITGDHDSYASASVSQAAGTTISITSSLNDPDPLFTSASDFTLQPLSPLIDNDATALNLLNEADVDLAGNVRIIGGKRDLGAYELPALPTAATQAATAISQTGASIAGAANVGGAAAGGSATLLYGTTASYGSSMPAHALSRSIGDQAVTDALAGLAPGTTYHYALRVANARGTSTSADRTFTTTTTPAPPAAPPAATTPAVAAVTKLSLSRTTLRPLTKGALVAVAGRGATLTIALTARATVTFSVVRRLAGVRVGSRCLAPGHGRRGKACTRSSTMTGTTTKTLAKGTSTLRFSARVAGHALKPGRYALRATPRGGKARDVGFRVVS